eukprot:3621648-Rhodomonas_salina.1
MLAFALLILPCMASMRSAMVATLLFEVMATTQTFMEAMLLLSAVMLTRMAAADLSWISYFPGEEE